MDMYQKRKIRKEKKIRKIILKKILQNLVLTGKERLI